MKTVDKECIKDKNKLNRTSVSQLIMSMQTTPPPAQSQTARMEINGRPYYIRSKGNVPYLYDIDTNDEVGYWSSKKGCYVMFSLYNRMMKQKYDEVSSSTSESESDSSSNSSYLYLINIRFSAR